MFKRRKRETDRETERQRARGKPTFSLGSGDIVTRPGSPFTATHVGRLFVVDDELAKVVVLVEVAVADRGNLVLVERERVQPGHRRANLKT